MWLDYEFWFCCQAGLDRGTFSRMPLGGPPDSLRLKGQSWTTVFFPVMLVFVKLSKAKCFWSTFQVYTTFVSMTGHGDIKWHQPDLGVPTWDEAQWWACLGSPWGREGNRTQFAQNEESIVLLSKRRWVHCQHRGDGKQTVHRDCWEVESCLEEGLIETDGT